jgi:BASS family bile acid:Na+ symporter
MDDRKHLFASLAHFIHKNLFAFVLSSYAVAAIWPTAGVRIRDVSFGVITVFGETTRVSLPVVMLTFLLFNAGLAIHTAQLKNFARCPLSLAAGLAGNLLVPVAFILVVSQTMRFWHNPNEVQSILVGLAIVASMPIAGSSTAWSQNANGDSALSLGLVVFSTLLSPLTTPVMLRSVYLLTTRDYSENLHELVTSGTGCFLALSVILPSVLGMAGRAAMGEARVTAAKPFLKSLNSVNLVLLNYSNAALSLPQTVADPDWDFLVVILVIVAALCLLAFATGSLIGRLLHGNRAQRISLMFGLGMNNNGTGLVLASVALADYPRVLLPIIFYNLAQHLVAGGVDFVLSRKCGAFRSA